MSRTDSVLGWGQKLPGKTLYGIDAILAQSAHFWNMLKVNKKAKIRNGYNQVPHLTRDTIMDIMYI